MIRLACHGGAGQYHGKDQSAQTAFLRDVTTRGQAALLAGASALDVVTDCVAALEDCGLYVAGKGTGPNSVGDYELDASIMCGHSRKAGGVAALQGYRSPVRVARKVLSETPHILLAGQGAANFAASQNCERVDNPAHYYITRGTTATPGQLDTGTVGAVALDNQGQLAAATSTGGLLGKMQGRVGDTPLIGSGCWADKRVAVSCTGQGEYFIKAAVASDIAARLRYTDTTLADACGAAIKDMGDLGGYGGVIAVSADGQIAHPYNSEGLRRAYCDGNGPVKAGAAGSVT